MSQALSQCSVHVYVRMCREAGVRSLKQLLEKTYRKVALKLVKAGMVGPTPTNDQNSPAQPGDMVSEHGGVGMSDKDEPQQAPPETSAPGDLLLEFRGFLQQGLAFWGKALQTS